MLLTATQLDIDIVWSPKCNVCNPQLVFFYLTNLFPSIKTLSSALSTLLRVANVHVIVVA